jgi:hypothetical protein
VRLEPLYRLRFTYPEGWAVSLGGEWEQHLYLADGTCEGGLAGRFRGANIRSGEATARSVRTSEVRSRRMTARPWEPIED